MRWRALVVGSLALLLGACGGGAAAPTPAPPAVATIPVPSSVPSVTRAAASPAASPLPQSTATAQAARSDTVYVGNTDGEGVFIRKTPAMADRVRAYPDGTPLTIVGDDVDGDGQHWKHVKTPDGLDGYVPAMYVVNAPP